MERKMTQEEKINNLWNQYDDAIAKGYKSYAEALEKEIFEVIARMPENCVYVNSQEIQ